MAPLLRTLLSLRLYRPEGIATPAPALLYIHGGAFVLGEVWHFDNQRFTRLYALIQRLRQILFQVAQRDRLDAHGTPRLRQ